jgi:hypothetical protein
VVWSPCSSPSISCNGYAYFSAKNQNSSTKACLYNFYPLLLFSVNQPTKWFKICPEPYIFEPGVWKYGKQLGPIRVQKQDQN